MKMKYLMLAFLVPILSSCGTGGNSATGPGGDSHFSLPITIGVPKQNQQPVAQQYQQQPRMRQIPCQHRIQCRHINPYTGRPAHPFDTVHPYDLVPY